MRKILLIALAVIVVVVVAAPFALPLIVDLNSYKPEVAKAVRDATGRELEIRGDISYSLLPRIEFSVSDVRLENAPGSPTPEMASVASVKATVAFWPLLGRKLIVESLIIEEPSLFLEVAADGRPNWAFETAAKEEEGGAPPELNDLRLGDVRIENGMVSYIDTRTGQVVQVRDIDVAVALADIASPLSVVARMAVNDEPVNLDVSVDSPAKLLAGERVTVAAALASKYIETRVDGSLQQQPVPGFDGTVALDVGSVGALAAWLQQPLDPSQPDPGPLKVQARFVADGPKVALQEATIEGEALAAKASGSFDVSGEVAMIALDIESGVLDIDRYLPPPAPPSQAQPAAPARQGSKPVNPLTALPDAPIDLAPLRGTEARVRVDIGGVKVRGFEVGKVAFTAVLKSGVLDAELSRLSLYGGNVSGSVRLDGAGEGLGAEVDLGVDKVNVGRLARAASGEEAQVTGIASGSLKASARGASPRALAQALSGELLFELSGVDVKAAPAAVSALSLEVKLPDLETPPTLKGSVVYNKQRVDMDLTVDPLNTVLSAERFNVAAKLKSKLVSASYEGSVQQRPVPGLDGDFGLDVTSVGQLAAWLGQPLTESQPDPGPLKVRASFAADGGKVTLEQATIEGTALSAKADGSFDGSGEVTDIVLNLETGVLDIDRYLPPPATQAAATPETTPAAKPAADPLAGLSDEALDLGPLRRANADVRVSIGGLKAMGYEVGHVGFTAALKDGVLDADLSELALYGGKIAGKVNLDGSRDALGVAVDLSVADVSVDALARATTGEAPVVGIANGTLQASTRGASPRALAQGLKGKLAFELGGIDVKEAAVGTVSEVALTLDLPGIEEPPSLAGAVVYNGERVTLDVSLDPLKKVLGGERFALKLALASNLVTAAYDGSVQQAPVPGLDGDLDLDVPSVGKLAAWLGQPLAASQPDPGSLKLSASFEADGDKAAVKSMTIEGKAVKATAEGSVDSGGKVPSVVARIDVSELDLDAYLPPKEKATATKAGAPAAAKPSQGWSEEPFELAPLSQVKADIQVQTGPVTYRGLAIEKSRITALLEDGVLKAVIEELLVAEGTVEGEVTLDGSAEEAALDYRLAVKGVEAKPILTAFADYQRLSGTMELETKGQARGRSQKDMVSSLDGDGSVKFTDGAIEGINLGATLRKAKSVGFDSEAGEHQQTDFAELGGTFTIIDGVVDNRDFKMLAPVVRVTGAGQVPMPPRTVDYEVEAKLVATTKGQGGDDSLTGLPIPIKITGSWDEPSYKVDWASVFQQAALDPSRIQNMSPDLKSAAEGFGIALPGLGGSDSGGGIGGMLKSLPGLSSGSESTTEGTAGTATEESSGGITGALKGILTPKESTSGETTKEEEPAVIKGIKGLFGN